MSEEVKNNEQEESSSNEPLNEGHYIEAIDRAYITASFIETTLIEHAVFEKHPELKTKVEMAQQLILDAYQEIGGLIIRLFTPESELPDFMKDKK